MIIKKRIAVVLSTKILLFELLFVCFPGTSLSPIVPFIVWFGLYDCDFIISVYFSYFIIISTAHSESLLDSNTKNIERMQITNKCSSLFFFFCVCVCGFCFCHKHKYIRIHHFFPYKTVILLYLVAYFVVLCDLWKWGITAAKM